MSTVYEKDYDYPVESNRYRLIYANNCPFAHRVTIARELLGLDEVISQGATSPVKTDKVWDFTNQKGGVDPVLGVKYVQNLYHTTNPNYNGPYSVPILVDVKTNQVVNQESLDLVYDFATRFKSYHKKDAPVLYPEGKDDEISDWIKFITEDVLFAANRAGFAKDQEKYDENVDIFFKALDKIDQQLEKNTFLLGNQLTVADIILYTPLIRLEVVYYSAFGVNKRHIYDYKNLWPYMKKLYQIPAFKKTTNFEEIKKGFYLGKTGQSLFTREVVPVGPDLSYWNE